MRGILLPQPYQMWPLVFEGNPHNFFEPRNWQLIPHISNSTSKSYLRLAKFWGFWFLIRTMETSMYFAHGLWIEYSNQVLFLQPSVTNPFGLTSTNWGFLPSDLHCCISRSNACLLNRVVYMWVVWIVLGDVVSAPLLAPRLRVGHAAKWGPTCRVNTRCLPSIGTLVMPSKGPMFFLCCGH